MGSIHILLVVTLHCLLPLHCDGRSSVQSLTEQVSNNGAIFKAIREFQQRRLNELEKLQSKIDFVDQEHVKANRNPVDYLSNPINAYKLIKRVVIDWDEIHDFISDGNTTYDFGKAWKAHIDRLQLPSESDLYDAIKRITSNEVDGASSDLILGPKLGWDECYEIGVRLYDKGDFMGALGWLQQALGKINDAQEYSDEMRVDIVEYIAFSQYILGNAKEAYVTLEQVLDVPELNSTVADARAYFRLNLNGRTRKTVLAEPHIVNQFTNKCI